MKTLFCLVALTAIAHSAGPPKGSRNFIDIGAFYSGDRLLSRSFLYRPAVNNTIQYEDYVYRGNATTRISAIQATEQGFPQYPSIWIKSGGLGHNNVTLSIQTLKGYGCYYLIDIWGH